MRRLLTFLVARGQESSTWAAAASAGATLAGVNLAPEKAAAIATLGALVCAAIAAATPQHKDPDQ